MKKYGTAIIILVAILGGLYYLFDESLTSVKKAKKDYETTQSDVDSYKSEREVSSNQIVSLNKKVKDSVEFLNQWKSYYTNNRDYESIINKVAEKTNCAVVGRQWGESKKIGELKKANIGKLDYEVDSFTGIVVGDYRDIIKFIGEMESQMSLSTVWNLEFKQGVNEVTCTITVYLPIFSFWGGASL